MKFACKMTQVGHAGAPNIGFAMVTPPDILQEFISFKPIKGTYLGHGFLVANFTVEITVSRDGQPPSRSDTTLPSRVATGAEQRAALSAVSWDALEIVIAVSVLGAAVFFFAGPGMAVAALVVGAGLAGALWHDAEAKGLSGSIMTGRGDGNGPVPAINVIVIRPSP